MDLLQTWADAMAVGAPEAGRWVRAGMLHDTLKDASPEWLADVSDDPWGIPALRHGPAAAIMAERDGELDRGVLDAVRFHSVGCAGWDRVGQMVYLADFLEPARALAGVDDTLRVAVPADPEWVLREVAALRRDQLLERGRTPLPEMEAFWNALG